MWDNNFITRFVVCIAPAFFIFVGSLLYFGRRKFFPIPIRYPILSIFSALLQVLLLIVLSDIPLPDAVYIPSQLFYDGCRFIIFSLIGTLSLTRFCGIAIRSAVNHAVSCTKDTFDGLSRRMSELPVSFVRGLPTPRSNRSSVVSPRSERSVASSGIMPFPSIEPLDHEPSQSHPQNLPVPNLFSAEFAKTMLKWRGFFRTKFLPMVFFGAFFLKLGIAVTIFLFFPKFSGFPFGPFLSAIVVTELLDLVIQLLCVRWIVLFEDNFVFTTEFTGLWIVRVFTLIVLISDFVITHWGNFTMSKTLFVATTFSIPSFLISLSSHYYFVYLSHIAERASVSPEEAASRLASLKVVKAELSMYLEMEEGMKRFKKFLVKEFAAENIMFWKITRTYQERYNQLVMSKVLQESVIAIYNRYISIDSPLCVNLSDGCRRRIERAILKISKALPPHLISQISAETPRAKQLSSKDSGGLMNVSSDIIMDIIKKSESSKTKPSKLGGLEGLDVDAGADEDLIVVSDELSDNEIEAGADVTVERQESDKSMPSIVGVHVLRLDISSDTTATPRLAAPESSSTTRRQSSRGFRRVSVEMILERGLFDEAREEVLKLMASGPFMRFRRLKEYQETKIQLELEHSMRSFMSL